MDGRMLSRIGWCATPIADVTGQDLEWDPQSRPEHRDLAGASVVCTKLRAAGATPGMCGCVIDVERLLFNCMWSLGLDCSSSSFIDASAQRI
jgi:hypothetical protein